MPKKTNQTNKTASSSARKEKEKKEEAAAVKPEKRRAEKAPGDPEALKTQIVTVLFWIAALLTAVFFFANLWDNAGPLIRGWCMVLYGLFGYGGLLAVCFFILLAVEWKRCVVRRNALYKTLFALLFMVIFSALLHVILIMSGAVPEPTFPGVFNITKYWYTDGQVVGGGVFGGFFGGLFYLLMHGWISILTCVIFLVADLMFYFEVTPARLVRKISAYWEGREERAEARAEAKALREEERASARAAEKARAEAFRREEALFEKENTGSVRKEGDRAGGSVRKAKEETTAETFFADAGAKDELSVRTGQASDTDLKEPVRRKNPGIDFDFSTEEDAVSGEKPEDGGEVYDFEHIPEQPDEPAGDWNNTDFGFGNEDEEIDLSRFFPDPVVQEDSLSGSEAAPPEAEEEVPDTPVGSVAGDGTDALPEKPKYVFPPTSLLTRDDSPKTEDDRDELMRNARKLVEVLKSFRVETDIVNISRGPTITRYELAPKIGVRVRAIANLVDDIALNLETSGVRIEAPIPGKAAVGVEVPNRTQATVYLRELIESEAFRSAKSKLTAALGVDVSGAPLLMDIAKMPHLLIAGATGMGKSVSVNSIIMSLLYKATPDELKLILVDPKKVELNVYNKLPHLLIPVVNNPKKAAGALATAVNEMERRFELIESVGVRDIKGYNKLTESDPTKEFLPQIVIIIDELADLMMTAKDDVEDSICRIAQKARAAGIHLIICTQRPSVDVITGLIKANIPSRIAFTVASNVDSRTIIDIAGAEKLIGRGDMLFAPVGAMKPIRAQGAFVSDKEVEAVTDFIKNQATDVKYDDSFLNQVEIEAERCGQQKKKVAGEEIDSDEETDPKFYDAVEVALDMGKISTSLLQRRLSLGYGRAAKIVDKMEQMGIVGPPEGQKPRNILISRRDFQEMMMHRDDTSE